MTGYPVGSVKVSHDVVETLVERGSAGVTEVARALDVPKSTAYDHLRTLEQVGYVVNDDGQYRLGTKFLHLGETARDRHELFVNGRREAHALHEEVDGKYVQLVTEENDRCAVLLATGWREGDRPARAPGPYPTRFRLHTNAPGKAILAHRDDEAIERFVSASGLPTRTANTVRDEAELRTELEAVRENGYAVDEGELISGMTGVAAPVVAEGRVRGAVAVYAPSGEFDDDPGGSGLAETVQQSARAIEAKFIFTPE
ncbi:IclR family transcriptional regulator [Natronomonas marina]|uniref:IclR family transcriptional regulator n=1 Tax=Natronomonas marina TaxID=2961939 RepID=UPI0020C967A5|nr:IclR family transcriptional regulator [Natronomonas marina]